MVTEGKKTSTKKLIIFGVVGFGLIILISYLTHNKGDSTVQSPPTEKGETVTIPIDENRSLEIDVDKWNEDVEKYEYGGN